MKNNKKLMRVMLIVMVVAVFTISVSANGLAESKPVQGLKNLIADATLVLTVLCPTACGLAAIGFAIRRGMADEQDGKLWTKRITTAITWGVGGGLISGFIAIISNYFT